MDLIERRKIVQDISRDVLKDVIAFCEKHDIEYFMIFGSLLGVIRHKGMIPWDDDIDVAMTRENYNRFLACVKQDGKELLARNHVKINGSGSEKYASEIKVGRLGTVYCPKIGADLDINKEITVDIFCVDHLKNGYLKHINLLNKFRLFLSVAKLNWTEKRFMIRVFNQESKWTKYLKISALCILHLVRMVCTEAGIEKFIIRMAVDTSKRSKFVGVVMGVRLPISFSSGFKLINTEFDGMNVLIPDNYDEILTRIYGDYMTPPPENQRFGNDRYEVVLEVNGQML